MPKQKTARFHRSFDGRKHTTSLCYRHRWFWWLDENGHSCCFLTTEPEDIAFPELKERAKKLGFTHWRKSGEWSPGPRSGKF